MKTATHAGIRAGLIELRQSFTGTALLGQLLWPVATLVAIFFLRDSSVAGISLGPLILPSSAGMFVALGLLLTVQHLAADREDGTLLRAKATPNGIRGYLTGKFVLVSVTVLVYLVMLLVPGALLIGGLSADATGWLTFAWVLVLGLLATQTLGAVLGALVRSSRGAGVLSLPLIGLIAISGIFYPITALPRLATGHRAGAPRVLAWPRHAIRPPPRRRGRRRDRGVMAARRDGGRPRRLGGRRADRRSARPAPDGPTRIRFPRRTTTHATPATRRLICGAP
jgi:ABC-type transport system involved in cytochrome c biogenesis permease component